jgi:N-methylhydantoinase A
MVDVHVIGAGGGSVAWLDDAGALKVGPQSAGADPGPVAYALGGSAPTLTDANIILHRLDPTGLLGGRMKVDEFAARGEIERCIAGPLGVSAEQAALGVIRIAVANMSRAIRAVSTAKGHDVGEFVLFAFGGAGPLHAAAVAEECGIRRALIPVQPGTMCARGILLSDISLDLVRSAIIAARPETWPQVVAQFAVMQSEGIRWLATEGIPAGQRKFERSIDARYKGQNHEVSVHLSDGEPQLASFLAGFAEAHRREHGYDLPDRSVEVVNCRLKSIGGIERPPAGFHVSDPTTAPKSNREVHFDQGWSMTPVFERASLPVGTVLEGPAVIDEMSATTLLPPGWCLQVDNAGNLLLEQPDQR